ncbi:TPA: hypothetical protein NJ372_003532 [Vibrio parahaemolyticus]|uniref:hypothetical protein n=1 Tax=Vibrio parahaemolyticus TaxID=670 RepID=UPI0022B452AE|nr:hypothetical protein [Vibrio parahaemolyticus]MCZ6382428.1 hypothetical protein [Vibrio parahaemolyticus]HCG7256489.1 hypothetical protein [Vibrio parahaemolyticus]
MKPSAFGISCDQGKKIAVGAMTIIKKYLEVTTRYEKLAINYESVVAAEVEQAVPSTDDDITEEETDTPSN